MLLLNDDECSSVSEQTEPECLSVPSSFSSSSSLCKAASLALWIGAETSRAQSQERISFIRQCQRVLVESLASRTVEEKARAV